MAKIPPPTPQPFHPPVGTSDESYPANRRWLGVALSLLIVLAAAVFVLLRP